MAGTWLWLWILLVNLARKTNGWDLAVAMDIDGLLYTPIWWNNNDGWLWPPWLMSIDSCWDNDDGLALTSHVPCTSIVDLPCVLLWMYIGCINIMYLGCRCLVSWPLTRLDLDTTIADMVGLLSLVTYVIGDTDVLHSLYDILMMMASFVYHLICCI